MLASYLLSRTLIPTLVMYIMRGHEHRAEAPKSSLGRFQRGFECKFEEFRRSYEQLLETTLEHRGVFVACFLAFCIPFARTVHFSRTRLLSASRRRRPLAPACAGASRLARGGNGPAMR